MIHQISTGRLTLERLKEIIDNKATLVLSEEAKMAIIKCRNYLDAKMEDPERPLYGITRRAWARNSGSIAAIKREMARTPGFTATLPNLVDDSIIASAF